MKTGTVLVAVLFALTSFPILGQQAPMDNPSNNPAAQPSSPPAAPASPDSSAGAPTAPPSAAPGEPSASPAPPEQARPAAPAASPEPSASAATPAVEMRPVNGELVSKLDSKTAKTGDDVVVETKSAAKTADGTEIPKGSKLVGHVVGVQSSKAGQNSEVVLQFDQAQLKGGQNLPIHSEIQAVEPAEGAAASGGSGSMPSSGMSRPSTGAATPSPGGDNGGGSSGNAGAAAPGYAPGAAEAAGSNSPAAGTVVARTGSIAIRATSIPGVLLANNEPGQQDPRMGQASSILLGSKQDVQLEGGTKMVIGVAAAGGSTNTK
jgi:hypothetical protein